MTDHKDEDDSCKNRGHSGVSAVSIAAHEVGVVCVSSRDCTKDETVEDRKEKHWQEAHHWNRKLY